MPRTWQKKMVDVDRASFQYNGEFALFRHYVEGAGTVVYQHETYKGEVLEAKVSPKESFDKWVGQRINQMLKEVVA